jgi:hypothetical protein
MLQPDLAGAVIGYSGGDFEQIRTYATKLVRSAPDLIVGSGTLFILVDALSWMFIPA